MKDTPKKCLVSYWIPEMPEPRKIETRFHLPIRVRSRKHAGAELQARLDLIDRIADLQGITVAEQPDDAVPCRVDVYLRDAGPGALHKKRPPSLLCSLSRDGIAVYGLDRWARYQVLARGWGGLNEACANVHLPRDTNELETVWQIVRRSYDNQKLEPERELETLVVSTWDWPKYSRTSLQ
jgi:hypothetical protein